METAHKHYKFINSTTGYVIYYHTLTGSFNNDNVKEELEKIKAQVATQYQIPANTLYWEEIIEEER